MITTTTKVIRFLDGVVVEVAASQIFVAIVTMTTDEVVVVVVVVVVVDHPIDGTLFVVVVLVVAHEEEEEADDDEKEMMRQYNKDDHHRRTNFIVPKMIMFRDSVVFGKMMTKSSSGRQDQKPLGGVGEEEDVGELLRGVGLPTAIDSERLVAVFQGVKPKVPINDRGLISTTTNNIQMKRPIKSMGMKDTIMMEKEEERVIIIIFLHAVGAVGIAGVVDGFPVVDSIPDEDAVHVDTLLQWR
jgi:hypothetical protein